MAEGTLVIAMDGPAGSGKTTLAKMLAAHFGLAFLDTGLLYRAVGRRMLDDGLDPHDEAAALKTARALKAEDVDPERLAGETVGGAASVVAAFPGVRAALLPFQRDFARQGRGAVLAGRDTGSVVCPDAEVKLFIDAAVEQRARRRFEELQRRGDQPIYERVLDELKERDRRDQDRAVAPMSVAAGAVVIDTTALDVDEAFKKARSVVEQQQAALKSKR